MTPVVDVHAHHVGADLVDAIRADGAEFGFAVDDTGRVDVGGRRTGLPVLAGLTDVDARLAFMDGAGIDVQLVAGWMDLAGYHLPVAAGSWLARRQNEALASVAAKHPDRLRAVAAVPLQDTEAAVREVRYAVGELAHVAVQIGTRVEERGLDDEALEPFWATVEELGVPVLVHPAELDVPERHRRLFLHIVAGNPAETTFAACALLLGGVLDRHPAMRVMFVHGGGFVAYQLGRLDRAFTAAPDAVRPRAKGPASQYLRQVYCDTVLHDVDALRHLVTVHGDGRVLAGSDYPFPMRDADPVNTVTSAFEAETAQRILRSNADELLGRR